MNLNLIDREALGTALAYLAGALPCKVLGIAVVTPKGQLVAHYLGKYGSSQIKAAVALAQRAGERMGGGAFRYTLTVGDNGAMLAMPLGDEYILWINVTRIRSFDAFLDGVGEGLVPLIDVLGLSVE